MYSEGDQKARFLQMIGNLACREAVPVPATSCLAMPCLALAALCIILY